MHDSQAEHDLSQEDWAEFGQQDNEQEWWMEQDAVEERKAKEAQIQFWDNFSESIRKVL